MNNSSDDTIVFDENGRCNYCKEAEKKKIKTYFPNEKGQQLLQAKLQEIKEYGKDKKYDCIMGISGGLDSSYLAYLGCKWGLRILAVHIDDGFDTEISKRNIERLVKAAGVELHVIKPYPVQFNALTKAYFMAGVPNAAAPQDNVLFASLYDLMRKEKIKYFLSGGNFALENILQSGNSHSATDVINIKDINKKFGTQKTDKLKFISSAQKWYDKKMLKIESPRLLNYIDYNRDRAFAELKEFCGFEYYGSKHLENMLTAFIQLYWLPEKFGVDKRTSHYSSMILSGQMTREEAIELLKEPIYEDGLMSEYISVIKEKLGISEKEFEKMMGSPPKKHTDFKIDKKQLLVHKVLKKLRNII